MPIINGDNSANVLNGTDNADQINGFGGNDRILPGLGSDTIDGGLGVDLLVVDYSALSADYTSTGMGQVDLPPTFITAGDLSVQLYFLNMEQFDIRTGSGNDSIYGGDRDDRISTGAGNDVLGGNGGVDILRGGAGSDIYVVENVLDRVFEDNEEGIDRVVTSVNFSIVGQYVEDMDAATGAGDINLRGNSLENLLNGNEGANRLNGDGGADWMRGFGGNDTFVVDNEGDLVSEDADAGNDTVESSISYALTDNVENLRLTALAANATGNALANQITGNGAANIIDGGAGADVMRGGASNDTYYVDDSGDRVYEGTGAKSGFDTVYSSVTFNLSGQYVERLQLTGTADINGSGNSLANQITGNSGDNLLRGFDGNDSLFGNGGEDTLLGGAGADEFRLGDIGGGSVTHIADFMHATDKIYLIDSAFYPVLGTGDIAAVFVAAAAAQDADDRLIYNAATGEIFVDSDGTGEAAAILVATVAAGTMVTASDFLMPLP